MEHKWEIVDRWASGAIVYRCIECKHWFSTRWLNEEEVEKNLNANNCDEFIAFRAIQRLSK